MTLSHNPLHHSHSTHHHSIPSDFYDNFQKHTKNLIVYAKTYSLECSTGCIMAEFVMVLRIGWDLFVALIECVIFTSLLSKLSEFFIISFCFALKFFWFPRRFPLVNHLTFVLRTSIIILSGCWVIKNSFGYARPSQCFQEIWSHTQDYKLEPLLIKSEIKIFNEIFPKFSSRLVAFTAVSWLKNSNLFCDKFIQP